MATTRSYTKILELLTPRERRNGLLVAGMMIGLAVLETMGVASIMPFLAVLANPDVVNENEILAAVYTRSGLTSVDDFLFWLGVAAFLLVLTGSAFRTLTMYMIYRYTEMRRHSISSRLLETYLRQPYIFFLDRHSGDLAKSILSEVDQLVVSVFRPLLSMIAYSVVALGIVLLLVVLDPLLALVVGVVIGGVYSLIFWLIRGKLTRIGKDRAVANGERFETAGEALAGIKDIKVLGREHVYLERFASPSNRFARHQATRATLAIVPKYTIEAIGFGGILGLALFLMATRSGLGEALPLLGLYAFAGYRLLPSAQQIYASLTQLRFGMPAVDLVVEDLRRREHMSETIEHSKAPLKPKRHIKFEHVSFRYPGSEISSLNNIDLTLAVGTSTGIVGTTGAGKTTLLDLLLGLLEPTDGQLYVDDQPVTGVKIRNWQRAIGYVPQKIYLNDTTIRANIAFGVQEDEVDNRLVKRVAKMAQIHDFIMSLPEGYDTDIGERGVRLSGGQQQRIGIARALYTAPSVIVFDEATSALDHDTESGLMEAITGLRGETTLVMVAHRITTVRACDQIVLLKDGRVHAIGDYEQLINNEVIFRRLAGVE